MANVTWVCFDCRSAVRRPWSASAPPSPVQRVGDTAPDQVWCSHCHRPCRYLGTKVKVPPKRDARGWQRLRERITNSRLQMAAMLHRASVQRRHRIEKRINALQSRPPSGGIDALVKELRAALAET